MNSPMDLGFYTTLVLEGAEKSLAQGSKLKEGATLGQTIDLRRLVTDQLGAAAAKEYGMKDQFSVTMSNSAKAAAAPVVAED
jgi:hypothetical protein